jgi:hypothetical protein
MPTKIVTTITSPGKLRLAATFEIHIGAPAGPVLRLCCREGVLPEVLTGYGLVAEVVRTSGNTARDKPGRGQAPTT